MKNNRFTFFSWIFLVDKKSLKSDLFSGFIGCLISVPQCLAYSIIAGLPAHYGLYAAIFSSTIAAIFGSSNHMVSGPTAVLSIVSASIISEAVLTSNSNYIDLMFLLTFLVGFFQLLFFVFKLGFVFNFISKSVVHGFTSGAAVLIAVSQLKPTILEYSEGLSVEIIFMISTVFLTFISRNYVKSISPLLVSMALMVVFSETMSALLGVDISTLESIPNNFSPFYLFSIDFNDVSLIGMSAFSISVLATMEAVLISKSISYKSKQRIVAGKEIFGQSLSNLIGAFFKCYPSSGSFTRSAVNFESGSITPLATFFCSLFIVACIVIVPDITTLIPVSVMSGIILYIAIGLFDYKYFLKRISAIDQDSVCYVITLVICIFVSVDLSIVIGVLLSISLYLKRTSQPEIEVSSNYSEYVGYFNVRICGSFYFASSDYIKEKVISLYSDHESLGLIVSFEGVNFFDRAGEEAVKDMIDHFERQGIDIKFSNLRSSVLKSLSNEVLRNKIERILIG